MTTVFGVNNKIHISTARKGFIEIHIHQYSSQMLTQYCGKLNTGESTIHKR